MNNNALAKKIKDEALMLYPVHIIPWDIGIKKDVNSEERKAYERGALKYAKALDELFFFAGNHVSDKTKNKIKKILNP